MCFIKQSITWGIFLNEYARGALEALTWVRGLLKKNLGNKEVLREVELAIDDILSGVSVDFRNRLRSIS